MAHHEVIIHWTGRGKYIARLADGTVLCHDSPEPVRDAARSLLATGRDPADRLVIRWQHTLTRKHAAIIALDVAARELEL